MFRYPFVAPMLVAKTLFLLLEFYLSKLEIFYEMGGIVLVKLWLECGSYSIIMLFLKYLVQYCN